MLFAFLFGLSMDYEVFILSRRRSTTAPAPPSSCDQGIGRTGRLV